MLDGWHYNWQNGHHHGRYVSFDGPCLVPQTLSNGLPTSAVTVGKIAKKTVLILDITERLFTAGVLYSSLWPVVTTFLISQKGYWQLGTSTVHCGQWLQRSWFHRKVIGNWGPLQFTVASGNNVLDITERLLAAGDLYSSVWPVVTNKYIKLFISVHNSNLCRIVRYIFW